MTMSGMSLNKGDLLLTGSPEGINFIKPDDRLEATMYSDLSKTEVLAKI